MRKETRCRHIGYSFRLAARVLLYAPFHRHDNTYLGLCYTSRGALGGTRNSSMGPPHEGSIRRPIAPRANALTTLINHVCQPRIEHPVSVSHCRSVYHTALRFTHNRSKQCCFGSVPFVHVQFTGESLLTLF